MTPSAAVSAGPEPEIPAKITPTIMVTTANPPGIGPTRRLTSLMSRFEIPHLSKIRPAKIKNGSARSWNFATPA